MKRLGHILLNALTVLSLLLCMGTVALWVRSHGHTDRLAYRRLAVPQQTPNSTPGPNHERVARLCSAWSRRGRLVLWSQPDIIMTKSGPGWRRTSLSDQAENLVTDDPASSFLGFAIVRDPQPFTYLVVPYWSVLSLAATLPLARFYLHRRRRRRHSTGLCRHCGYDLRATPERCPECGRISAT